MTTKLQASITSDCVCENEETNEPLDYCDGCYDWQKEDVEMVIAEWATAHGIDIDDTPIRIDGTKLTWQGLSGYRDTYPSDIVNSLALNGDFRLEFYLDEDNTLTARRWSHDEPVGTGLFTFTKTEPVAEDE